MKPEDVIKQLVGDVDDWDQLDTMQFSVTSPSKFPDVNIVSINFDSGTVKFYDADGKETKQFAIKAELIEII